jgi:hypothetical protein
MVMPVDAKRGRFMKRHEKERLRRARDRTGWSTSPRFRSGRRPRTEDRTRHDLGRHAPARRAHVLRVARAGAEVAALVAALMGWYGSSEAGARAKAAGHGARRRAREKSAPDAGERISLDDLWERSGRHCSSPSSRELGLSSSRPRSLRS